MKALVASAAGLIVASGAGIVPVAAAQGLGPLSLVRRGPVAVQIASGAYARTISGGVAGGSVGNHAALWSGGQVVDVHPLAFSTSLITGRSGLLSVGYAGAGPLSQAPVVWVGAAPSVLPVPLDYVIGRAVSTDGEQIVGYVNEPDAERNIGDAHALVWNIASGEVVDLGRDITLFGVGGGVQVGTALGSRGTNATMWRGEANTSVDLHVQGQDVSVATDTTGPVQVGYVGVDVRVRHEGRPRDIRFYTAGYWTGSAESFVPLASPYRHSFALGISGETIVGYGNTTDAIGFPRDSHAVAWIGPARQYVDLHAVLPADMRTSVASDVDELGNIVGYGVTFTGEVRSFVWTVPQRTPSNQFDIEP